MGFFDRFVGKSRDEGGRARDARAKELEGDLAAAAKLYEAAGLFDDAARVLLLRADAAKGAEARLALLALAAELAEGEELRRTARARRALLAFDVLRGQGGALMKNEVLAVARELEEVGELERAADAFALAGDAESEVRALTAAGAIERLEDRLRASEASTRAARARELLVRRIVDHDRTAERRTALELARTAPDDERVADAARGIRARLLRGPVIDLEIDGAARRYALGREVTIGRGDATIVIASPAVSRRHVRIFRDAAGAPMVEDLGTRNGTRLAGARLTGPIPVGGGVRLELGGDVACAIAPVAGGEVTIELAGVVYTAPLGPLEIAGLQIEHAPGDEPFVVLASPPGAARPFLGDFQLAARVELCHGDEIRATRGGPARIRVPAARVAEGEGDVYARAPR